MSDEPKKPTAPQQKSVKVQHIFHGEGGNRSYAEIKLDAKLLETKVTKLFAFEGLKRVDIQEAAAGDIVLNEEYSQYEWVDLAELPGFEPKIDNIPAVCGSLRRLEKLAGAGDFVSV